MKQTKQDSYLQKVNIRVALRVAERLKTSSKIRMFYENRGNAWICLRLPSGSPKRQSLAFLPENPTKLAVKYSTRKLIIFS